MRLSLSLPLLCLLHTSSILQPLPNMPPADTAFTRYPIRSVVFLHQSTFHTQATAIITLKLRTAWEIRHFTWEMRRSRYRLVGYSSLRSVSAAERALCCTVLGICLACLFGAATGGTQEQQLSSTRPGQRQNEYSMLFFSSGAAGGFCTEWMALNLQTYCAPHIFLFQLVCYKVRL